MPQLPPSDDLSTREVTNQPPARDDADLWAGDAVLAAHRARFAALPDEGQARAFAESLATLVAGALGGLGEG